MNIFTSKGITLTAATLLAIGFIGCGGGGSSSSDSTTQTTDGVFKDANVQGMAYSSGSISGVTGADGSYQCETGKDVTFSIGSVTLGSVACGELITPVELVTNGTADTQTVVNIVKFLTMLDEDQDPTNGMQISTSTQTLAKNWPSVDFQDANFNTNGSVTQIVNDVNNNASQTHALPTDADAKAHLKATMMCAYAGGFRGSISATGITGDLAALVDPKTGVLQVVGHARVTDPNTGAINDVPFSGAGSAPMGTDRVRAVNGTANLQGGGTITFNLKVNSVNSATGTWNLPTAAGGINGNIAATRVGSSSDAQQRIVGHYSGSASGLFTLDIDKANNVTGKAYNPTSNEVFTITGSMDATGHITGSLSDGTTFAADYDTTTGTLSNTSWTNGSATGTITGSGCQLN